MGVYSQYAASVAESASGFADESYAGVVGAYRMMEESAINSHTIFESIIGRDYMEVYSTLDESVDMDAINESAIGDIWGKVIAFIQKIWQKILGILKSIKDRVVAVLTRDSKALVDKYKKEIIKKDANGDLNDKFKFKWKKKKNELDLKLKDILEDSDAGKKFNDNLTLAEANKRFFKSGNVNSTAAYDASNISNRDPKAHNTRYKDDTGAEAIRYVNDHENDRYKPYDSDELTDIREKTLGKIVNQASCTKSEFAKEYHDMIFDDEEELDSFSTVMNEIIQTLSNAEKAKNDIDRAEKEANRAFRDDKKKVESIQKEMVKLAGKETNTAVAAAANRQASRAISCYNIMSECITMTASAWTACLKEHVKQCRSVWIKAATWRKTATSESVIFAEACGQMSDFEVEQMFDFV